MLREHLAPFLFSFAVIMFLLVVDLILQMIDLILGKGIAIEVVLELFFLEYGLDGGLSRSNGRAGGHIDGLWAFERRQ